jgi:NADPH:quinone reductase-like Zn-dependent oxidoreductase
MFAYRIVPGENIRGLARVPIVPRQLHAQEVRVRVRAVALNYRDLMVARGTYPGSNQPVVPCSDGAGEVIALGPEVKRFRVGDRVIAGFFPDWIEGEIAPEKIQGALGGSLDGVLAQEIVLHEDALVSIPPELSFMQAATLPCAGLTAWNMLFVANTLQPGACVALLGTGGVSIWALQLAKAAGLRTIITSSNAEKLERARTLGADELVNYRATPEWQDEVLRLTDRRGADLVAELGGHDTLKRSIAATRLGGAIALIGGVSGFTSEIDILTVLGGKKLIGIYVGNRRMLEDLAKFVAASKIEPVIDRVFRFEDAQDAYAHLDAQRHLGKVVIEIPS